VLTSGDIRSTAVYSHSQTATQLPTWDLKSIFLEDPVWGVRMGINSKMLLKREAQRTLQ
jgi:hypothetical protein